MVWEPPWKRLVDDLKREGFESPYLDRLDHRLDRLQQRESLEKEILQEMAYALGKSEEKVNLALLECELAAREIEQAPDPGTRAERIEEFNRRRDRAESLRRELMIHREALGMVRHELLERFYPIPPRRRLE